MLVHILRRLNVFFLNFQDESHVNIVNQKLVQGNSCVQKEQENKPQSILTKSTKLPKPPNEERPVDLIRFDRGYHFAEYDTKTWSTRCKLDGCSNKTRVYCMKCNVHLCFTSTRNCFKDFHLQ